MLLLFGIIIFICYQSDKTIRLDDDLIGEQVYWLLKDGYVKSEMMRGYGNLHLEVHQTVFHKLFVYWGALISAVFGWSLYSLHAASLIFLVFFFLILYKQFQRNEPSLFWFAACFMLISYNVLYFSNCFRPEVMLMTFGFAAYISLERFFQKNGNAYLVLSSVLSGLAFATHPHGVIYCAAGLILLFIHKKYLSTLTFGCIAVIVFSAIYFADIIYFNQYDLFIHQLRNDPIINVQEHHWYTPVLKLLQEHTRVLFNEREIVITALLVTGILFNYTFLIKKHKNLLLYGLFCFITLGALTYSKSPQYLLLYFPFTVLIIGYSWKKTEESDVIYKKIVYRILLCGFVGIHLFFAFKKIGENILNISAPSLAVKNRVVAAHIPGPHDSLSILCYDNFIFDEIKHFRRIKTMTVYSFFSEQQHQQKMTLPQIIHAAKQDSIHYLIFDRNYLRYFETDTAEQDYREAKLIYKNSEVLILQPQ